MSMNVIYMAFQICSPDTCMEVLYRVKRTDFLVNIIQLWTSMRLISRLWVDKFLYYILNKEI